MLELHVTESPDESVVAVLGLHRQQYGFAVEPASPKIVQRWVVAEHDGQVVGVLRLVLIWKPCGAILAEIDDVMVVPECRQQGIGRTMVLFAEHIAKKDGAYQVVVRCRQENAGFYERLGYATRWTAMGKML